jgi:cytochrome c556
MNKKTRIIINLVASSLLISSLSVIADTKAQKAKEQKAPEVTFKSVMQGLLTNSLAINKGIFLEDFTMIEQAAAHIADHPKPDMAIRKKLMMNLGLEMGTFKSLDNVVHQSSVDIVSAAKEKNMEKVVKQYHQLIEGCLSCHADFKKRVSEILK